MSAIDSYTHAHVANFFNLPVYWVLEENKLSGLTYSNEEDMINKCFLSIGGGSGEHPALIIKNDAVIFQFMKNNIQEVLEPDLMGSEEEMFDYNLYNLSEKIIDKYMKDEASEELYYWSIDNNQWPLETFIDIDDKLKKYDINGSLESKIINTVALFIIHEMPLKECIQDDDLVVFAEMYRSGKWKNAFRYEDTYKKFVGFSGILDCQKAGKIIKDGKVVWGYSLNDWRKDNN